MIKQDNSPKIYLILVFLSYWKNFQGIRKLIRISHDKRAIVVRVIEVLLYSVDFSGNIRTTALERSVVTLLNLMFRRSLQWLNMSLCAFWLNGLKLLCPIFNSFAAKFQTTFVVCFSLFNKLSLEKKFIRKVERLNVKQRRSR